jgi:hypothetical protein
MSNPAAVCRKYTRQLLSHLGRAGDGKPLEVIVRIKDPEALSRTRAMAGTPPDKIAEREQQHAQVLLGNVVEFIQDLERQGAPVRLLDTSWLTHSVLARATPAIVHRLAEREEVDLVDLNAEIGILPVH